SFFLVERKRDHLIALFLSLLTFGLAYLGSQEMIRAAATLSGKEHRTVWGRGTIEVIQKVIWRLEAGDGPTGQPQDRLTLLPALEAGTEDPLLRCALPTILTYLDRDFAGIGRSV